ncbi:S-layer homology domain-containing protein [Paenibacillus macerans]|uniref:S-layer homology domain-containing protein n=1 Tax=Paenibacillus macerans TaxID=44252 RepID=UPI00203EF134|nr:S-layer homology domain-containing protein [Paenibacillus macerans]MCM3700204.1 S-layer homology domain-containing protein [Paenibacillus macerans]
MNNTSKFTSKWARLTLLMVIAISLMVGGTASAFQDVKGDREQKAIESLEKRGILKGGQWGNFKPNQKIDNASAISLIVSAFELNLDNLRFVKKPEASDYYSKVKNDAGYAGAFVIALYRGLDVPKDIDPSAKVTKEQFSHWLFQAIATQGEYVWPMIYTEIKDGKSIDADLMGSIQKLLNAGIVTLDKNKKFNPTGPITLSEAAGMLDRALGFVEDSKQADTVTGNLYDFSLSKDKVNGGIYKVTVSAMAPHPGYGIEVASIVFDGDKAVINYRIKPPEEGKFYPQVITEVKAVTYIPDNYKPVLGEGMK